MEAAQQAMSGGIKNDDVEDAAQQPGSAPSGCDQTRCAMPVVSTLQG